MTIAELMESLERIAPLKHAETWDNVGLIAGDPNWAISGPVVLTIDLTEEVLAEAVSSQASLIIAYHPPIWAALKRISTETAMDRAVLGALRAGIGIYSPHTALDAAPGGVTDWLCDMLSVDGVSGRTLGDRRALAPAIDHDPRQTHKIVTFVPATSVEAVRNALSSVGAGVIGEYTQCSFSLQGAGSFFGADGTSPAVGEAGQLEQVDEVRLEMVCPERSLALAVEMLRQFHPYEEPAFDIYALTAKPRREIGAGRRITLDHPSTPKDLAARLRTNLGVDAVKLAAAGDAPVSRIGVCPGAGASLLDSAIAEECEIFVTGEMRHHEALAAVSRGCSILLAGHTNTERGFLPQYASRIEELAPGVKVAHAASDRTLFRTLS